MAISVFDLFKIGIGPSSSHVVGPMKAVGMFLEHLVSDDILDQVNTITIELFGSLAWTGKGHGTDKALIMGLLGAKPASVDPQQAAEQVEQVIEQRKLTLAGKHTIDFISKEHIRYNFDKTLPLHSNAMMIVASDSAGLELLRKTYYSVGGGFVLGEDEAGQQSLVADTTALPHPFTTAEQLLDLCNTTGRSIDSIMLANEQVWRNTEQIQSQLAEIWKTMDECITRGMQTEGTLPGKLQVRRRAAGLYRKLLHEAKRTQEQASQLDWVNLYAIAVNEENAAGGRVVTAPTNGAAGIIPAVYKYYQEFYQHSQQTLQTYLLTAAAIGILFKENASISGAEVGCQGEVGSACSMAAGGLCALMGGSPEQIENAAEVAMEHNLGLTCDPVGGLVQIPCIERNAMASVKAINAARMAMLGDGNHYVSLDKVIKTMRDTGMDMHDKYKETARGGLAVNIIEC